MYRLKISTNLSYLSGSVKCLRKNVFHQVAKRAGGCRGMVFPKTMSSSHILRTASLGGIASKRIIRNPSCCYTAAAYGGLAPKQFIRNSSYYCVHPEKIKQFLKQKDGQMLCNFFDSEDYKRKAVDKLKQQGKLINDGTPKGVNEANVSYEHMLSCAQPKHKPKVIVQLTQEVEESPIPSKLKKNLSDARKYVLQSGVSAGKLLPSHKALMKSAICTAAVDDLHKCDTKKIYRKRSTILPIYLKKMEQNIAMRKKKELEDRIPLKKIFSITGNMDDRKQVNLTSCDTTLGKGTKKKATNNVEVVKSKYKGQYVARNLTTLVQKPKLSTYSHFLKTRHENLSLLPDCKIPLNEQEETDSISTSRRQVALTVTPPVIPSQPPNAKVDKETPAKVAEENSSWRRKPLRPSQNIKRVEELTRGCELNLPSESNAEFELDNNATDPDLNKVGRRNMSTFMLQESTKENMVDQVMTLFDRVKIDSRSKMGVEDQDGNHSVVESMGSRQIMREPSLTYKLVNSKKMRREMALKAQYKIMPNMEKKNMRTDTSICNKNNQLIVLSPLKSELECVKHLENDSRQSPLFLDSQKMSC